MFPLSIFYLRMYVSSMYICPPRAYLLFIVSPPWGIFSVWMILCLVALSCILPEYTCPSVCTLPLVHVPFVSMSLHLYVLFHVFLPPYTCFFLWLLLGFIIFKSEAGVVGREPKLHLLLCWLRVCLVAITCLSPLMSSVACLLPPDKMELLVHVFNVAMINRSVKVCIVRWCRS